MKILLQSKLLREEIKHWALILSLLVWSLIASILALKNNSKTILIGISPMGAEIITENNPKLSKIEITNFLKTFLENYYSYSSQTYLPQMEKSTNLWSDELFNTKKDSLIAQNERLTETHLTQTSKVISIDQLSADSYEATLELTITSKLTSNTLKIKSFLKISPHSRDEKNPWGYEITEVSDVAL
jgi:hypothetical protein